MGCSPRGRKESDTTERLRYVSYSNIAFPDRLISPSNMHLRFLQVCSWLDSSFFLVLNNILLSTRNTVYPSTSWKTHCLLPSLGNYE